MRQQGVSSLILVFLAILSSCFHAEATCNLQMIQRIMSKANFSDSLSIKGHNESYVDETYVVDFTLNTSELRGLSTINITYDLVNSTNTNTSRLVIVYSEGLMSVTGDYEMNGFVKVDAMEDGGYNLDSKGPYNFTSFGNVETLNMELSPLSESKFIEAANLSVKVSNSSHHIEAGNLLNDGKPLELWEDEEETPQEHFVGTKEGLTFLNSILLKGCSLEDIIELVETSKSVVVAAKNESLTEEDKSFVCELCKSVASLYPDSFSEKHLFDFQQVPIAVCTGITPHC